MLEIRGNPGEAKYDIYEKAYRDFQSQPPICPALNNPQNIDPSMNQQILDLIDHHFGHRQVAVVAMDISQPQNIKVASIQGEESLFLASMGKVAILMAAAAFRYQGNKTPEGFDEAMKYCMLPSNNSDCSQVAAIIGGAELKPEFKQLKVGGSASGFSEKFYRLNYSQKNFDHFRAYMFGVLAALKLFDPKDCSGLYSFNPYWSQAGSHAISAKWSQNGSSSSQAGNLKAVSCVFSAIQEGKLPFSDYLQKSTLTENPKNCTSGPCPVDSRCASEIYDKYPNEVKKMYRKSGSFSGLFADSAYVEMKDGRKLVVALAGKPSSPYKIGKLCLDILDGINKNNANTNNSKNKKVD